MSIRRWHKQVFGSTLAALVTAVVFLHVGGASQADPGHPYMALGEPSAHRARNAAATKRLSSRTPPGVSKDAVEPTKPGSVTGRPGRQCLGAAL